MVGKQLEAEVQSLLERAGFEVPRSREHALRIKREIPGKHQIDAMGWHEDFFVAVECTGKRKRGRRSLKSRISEISDELTDIRKWRRERDGPKAVARYVLATRNIQISNKVRLAAARKGIAVWDDDVLNYYARTLKAFGPWTHN